MLSRFSEDSGVIAVEQFVSHWNFRKETQEPRRSVGVPRESMHGELGYIKW